MIRVQIECEEAAEPAKRRQGRQVAIERVVANTVTDSVRQDLIEGFISKVGASR